MAVILKKSPIMLIWVEAVYPVTMISVWKDAFCVAHCTLIQVGGNYYSTDSRKVFRKPGRQTNIVTMVVGYIMYGCLNEEKA